MKKILIFFLVALFGSTNITFSQSGEIDNSNETNIIPPSPTSYQLGKYGQIPVGHFTGTPSITVPLYEYKSGTLSLPISLSYNSNGIKVNDFPTNVGLGWSLNTGGVITRIVKDEPDGEFLSYYPEMPLSVGNFYTIEKLKFLENADIEGKDTEADLFMFNFNGFSGKFIFTNKMEIVTIPYQNLKITQIVTTGDNMGFIIVTPDGIQYTFGALEYNKSISSIGGALPNRKVPVITSWYLTNILAPNGDQIVLDYTSNHYDYVSTYVENKKKTIDLFNHCSGGNSCPTYNTFSKYDVTEKNNGVKINSISSNNLEFGTIKFKYYDAFEFYEPNSVPNNYLIKEIEIINKNQLTQKYFNFNYLLTGAKRVFLTDIEFEDPNQRYQFNYIDPEGLCSRLSKDQDHWGYFNNAHNYYLLPNITDHDAFINIPEKGNREPNSSYAKKGLLEKIIYPTKGYTQIEYEPNTYSKSVLECPGSVNYTLFAKADRGSDEGIVTASDQTLEIQEDQDKVRLSLLVYPNECWDLESFPDDKIKAVVSIQDINTGEYAKIWRKSTGSNPWILENNPFNFSDGTAGVNNEYFVDLNEGAIYKLTIQPLFFCLSAEASFSYEFHPNPCYYTDKETEGGGLRVKRIIDRDPVTNKDNVTRYYYNQFNGDFVELNKSSGDPGSVINYVTRREPIIQCTITGPCGTPLVCKYYELSSNTIIPLYNTWNSYIYYKYVTISHGGDNFENGGETHKFVINRDVQGNVLSGVEPHLSASSWSNIGWDNGKEINSQVFKLEDGLVKLANQKWFNFTADERNKEEIYSYLINRFYQPTCENRLYYTCTQADLNAYFDVWDCRANHKHIWGWDHIHNHSICRNINSDMYYVRYYHPCQGHNENETIFFTEGLEYFNIVEYKTLSQWSYLDNTIETNYDLNGNALQTVTTNYKYNNPIHAQLSEKTVTNSKGVVIKEKYYYPGDFLEIENYATLIEKGIVGKPVKVEAITGSNQTGGKITKYNDDGYPIEIYDYESSTLNPEVAHDPATLGTNFNKYTKKLTLKYDATTKHIIETKSSDGIITTYIWGYGGAYPVAKIINTDYNTVNNNATLMNYINTLDDYTVITNYNRAGFITLNSNIRNQITSNVLFTTYTYDPLIGMTSETAPNGVTTYYEYDNFGRLQYIKDQDGNILKQYDYHYANQ